MDYIKLLSTHREPLNIIFGAQHSFNLTLLLKGELLYKPITEMYGVSKRELNSSIKYFSSFNILSSDDLTKKAVVININHKAVLGVYELCTLYTKAVALEGRYVTDHTKEEFSNKMLKVALKTTIEGGEYKKTVVEEVLDESTIRAKNIILKWNEAFVRVGGISCVAYIGTNIKPVKARLKNFDEKDFKIVIAYINKNAKFFKSESWFNFQWIVKSEENFQKVLDGWMDWKFKKKSKFNESSVESEMDKMERLMKGE
tara:strand:- start:128 stop:898 length:771 start_codon:yes stop_codon:yes gene_type:complete